MPAIHRLDSVSSRVSFREPSRKEVVRETFKKAAFAQAPAADPAERWAQIKKGLSAVRTAPAAAPLQARQENVEAAPVATPVSAPALPVAPAQVAQAEPGEAKRGVPAVAPEILYVNKAADDAKMNAPLTASAASGPGAAAADHWVSIRQAMRSGLMEKVEITSHKAAAGETLADLAQKYMGDPRRARILAKFNGLSETAALPEGASVRIPSGGIIDRMRMHETNGSLSAASVAEAPAKADAPAKRPAKIREIPDRLARPAKAEEPQAALRKATPALAASAPARTLDRIEMMIRQIQPVRI